MVFASATQKPRTRYRLPEPSPRPWQPERFQQILAGNRHNALLFAPRLGELKALRLVAFAHTDREHLCLGIQQAQHIGGITQILQYLLAEGDAVQIDIHIRVSVDVGINRFKIQRRKIKIHW